MTLCINIIHKTGLYTMRAEHTSDKTARPKGTTILLRIIIAQ